MQDVAEQVRGHYGRATIIEAIDRALVELGVDPGAVGPDDLKPVDEFHTGGVEATDALLDQLSIGPGTRVLDVGCGLGGTARRVAARFSATVEGFDLTPDFVAAGRVLTERVGLSNRVALSEGSALDMPVGDSAFDLALMLHVGMNLPDKPRLMREAARVLAPGGRFAILDIMAGEDADAPPSFPAPWAEGPTTSFVEPRSSYLRAAAAAGFDVEAERDRSAFALDYYAALRRRMAEDGPPPLGVHLLMGDSAGQKLGNYVADVKAGRLAPREMILRRP